MRHGKRIGLLLAILFFLAPALAFSGPTGGAAFTALGGSPASGQAACTTTPSPIVGATSAGGQAPWGRLSVTFQNQSTTPVYIAPRADVSTANAGLVLPTQGSSATFDRSSGAAAWYCVTASGTATVGWTEER